MLGRHDRPVLNRSSHKQKEDRSDEGELNHRLSAGTRTTAQMHTALPLPPPRSCGADSTSGYLAPAITESTEITTPRRCPEEYECTLAADSADSHCSVHEHAHPGD